MPETAHSYGVGPGMGVNDDVEMEASLQARIEELKKTLEVNGIQGEEREKFIIEFIKNFITAEKFRLGWLNDTSDLDKINDVELLMASGYNLKFIQRHHAVGQLLDAAGELAAEKRIEGVSVQDIYQALHHGAEKIRTVGLGADGEPDGRSIDLFVYAQWRKAKKYITTIMGAEDRDALLQQYGGSWDTMEEDFLDQTKPDFSVTITQRDKDGALKTWGKSNQPIKVVENLKLMLKKPSISADDFDSYYATIQKCQPSLQYLGTLRDKSIDGHHAENSGHAQMMKGLEGEYTYLPMTGRMAALYTRGDVAKTTPRHRAEGHPHEIGYYEENTSTCVGFEAEALRIWRREVTDYQVHQATKPRTLNNLMALSSQEAAMVDKQEHTMWFGKKVTKDGKVKTGKIYDGMRLHYDEMLKKERGYGITEIEIGDKIMTDIIAVHFVVNPRDWVMTFGKVSGFYDARDITSGTKALDEDKVGRPVLVFYAKHPVGQTDFTRDSGDLQPGMPSEYGEIHIRGFTALAKYVKWRVDSGDVPGIKNSNDIKTDFVKDISTDRENARKAEKGNENYEYDHTGDVQALAAILHDSFGDQFENALDIIAGKKRAKMSFLRKGTPVTIKSTDELQEALGRILDAHAPLLFEQAKAVTNEQAPETASRRLIEIMKFIVDGKDKLTPQALGEVVDKMPAVSPWVLLD